MAGEERPRPSGGSYSEPKPTMIARYIVVSRQLSITTRVSVHSLAPMRRRRSSSRWVSCAELVAAGAANKAGDMPMDTCGMVAHSHISHATRSTTRDLLLIAAKNIN